MIRTARVISPGGAGEKDVSSGAPGGETSDNAGAGARMNRDERLPAGHVLVMNDDIPSAKAASSRRFWGVRERAYRAADPKGLAPEAGATVELYLPPGRTVLSAALTFLLPLALFPVGYSLAGRLFPVSAAGGTGAGAEGAAFLVGFAFLLAGIPLGALIRKIAGGLAAVPVITRVLTSAEAACCSTKDAKGCGSCTLCG